MRQKNLEGVYDTHTNSLQYPKIMQPTHARWEESTCPTYSPSAEPDQARESRFPRVPAILKRNFLISDIYYVNPPVSDVGNPGPDGDILDVGTPGVATTSVSVAAEMPADCLLALKRARSDAMKWKNSWAGEERDGARAQLRITYNT